MEEIIIQGARIHNLKNINLTIPKHQLVVITGISGSGKSSLAFDILFEEGKNQYLRSIGILSGLDNQDRFDRMEGIGPTVAVHQNTVRQSNPRSTVGTKTGILNQLALIYASDGKAIGDHSVRLSPGSFLYTTVDGMCLNCQGRGTYFDVDLEQLVPDKKTPLFKVYESLQVTAGYIRILKKKYGLYFNTLFWELPKEIQGEVVYGEYENGKQSYCLERILRNAYNKGEDVDKVYAKLICPECHGERIGHEASEIILYGKRIGELGKMTLSVLFQYLNNIPKDELSQFSRNVIKNIKERLTHLIELRLGHLALYREMASLSGGELQRIFLDLHLESGQDSLIYVFDEPMAGLHPSEKQSMIKGVNKVRELGNTVIVVEHDKEMIRHADHIIEIGPGAGREGGFVVYQGNYDKYKKSDTLLSQYLSGKHSMLERAMKKWVFNQNDCLTLEHANIHYLRDVTVVFPLHAMVGIAGVSGSGKSTLIAGTLLKRLASAFNRKSLTGRYAYANGLKGVERIHGFVKISQEPIGRSGSSTPASYIGIWDMIRKLFAEQPEAKVREMSAGHFSFHSKGACQDCGGSGYEKIYLTSDFYVEKICQGCLGKRFRKDSLSINYHGKTITDVLGLSIAEALRFFADHSSIVKPLTILEQMGMGYLALGQPTSSLSGGEAQRLKLAKELGRVQKGNMLYVLDEPTTGLSLYDTELLLKLLDQLVVSGNSVIIIEHNTQVLKNCDYIIELGPEGGEKGGQIIAQGTPEQLRDNQDSMTGRYLL